MRSSVLIASAGLALSAGAALAEFAEFVQPAPTRVASFKLGTAGGNVRWTAGTPNPGTPVYDMDEVDQDGGAYLNQGTAVQSGNSITRLVADDGITISYSLGSYVSRLYFSVVNANTDTLAVRPRIRFYADNGGVPGTVIAGFSFNPISFDPSSSNLFYTNFSAGQLPLSGTQMTMWMGMTFDNNTGTSGASTAQMNFFGQATVAAPSPTVGSSSDNIFQTTAAGSNLVSNPPGSLLQPFDPGTNLAWGLVAAPAPSSIALLGLGGLITARRRRA